MLDLENPFKIALDFLNKGGLTMYALLFCSIFLFAIIGERFYSLAKISVDSNWLIRKLAEFLKPGKVNEAKDFLQKLPGALPRVMEKGLFRFQSDREDIEAAMTIAIQEQTPVLEGMVSALGTIAVIAPFLGLLGTITGLINSFTQIALKGTTGPAIIARGVYEALYATAAGLVIAIPAVIFYNYFRDRIRGQVMDMEVSANRLIEMIMLSRQGKPFPDDLLPAEVESENLKVSATTVQSSGGLQAVESKNENQDDN
jgi:biopolymer transport protein ExbB